MKKKAKKVREITTKDLDEWAKRVSKAWHIPGSDSGGKDPKISIGPSVLRRSPRDVREAPPFA